jgi:hypothetical protein
MKEREAQTANPMAASIAAGSRLSPIGVPIPVRTPHGRKQSQPDATTVGLQSRPLRSLREATQPAPRAGHYAVPPRSGLAVPVLDLVRVWWRRFLRLSMEAPSHRRSRRRSRRDQQQITLSQHGVYAHDYAQQQHRAHLQYQQPGSNAAAPSQYANGTLLSKSVTAPPPVVVHGHAQGLLSQVPQIVHRNTPETSSTSSAREVRALVLWYATTQCIM